MNFEYSEEQNMLHAIVTRMFSDSVVDHTGERWRETWQAYAELGLLGMAFDEKDGGIGAGPVETMIVMRGIGRGLCVSPFLASAVHATALLNDMDGPTSCPDIVAGLVDGSARLSVAHDEPDGWFKRSHVALKAEVLPDGFRLNGHKILVLGGGHATHYLVSGRTIGHAGDRDGVSLFLVEASTPGLVVRSRRMIDGRSVGELVASNVVLPRSALVGVEGRALPSIEKAHDIATVACLNEAVGALEELLSLTVDYLKTRRQFGTAIGTFQALQHQAVDMFIAVEQAKSMALYAVMQLDLDAESRRTGVGLAKVYMNRTARQVGEAAVQLHGAIGMTMESKAGRLFNRLAACQLLFGDTETRMASLLETTPDILAA